MRASSVLRAAILQSTNLGTAEGSLPGRGQADGMAKGGESARADVVGANQGFRLRAYVLRSDGPRPKYNTEPRNQSYRSGGRAGTQGTGAPGGSVFYRRSCRGDCPLWLGSCKAHVPPLPEQRLQPPLLEGCPIDPISQKN